MPNVYVVTGANRGIGLELSRQLLEDPKLAPVVLYGTARDGQPLKLKATHPESQIITVKADQANAKDVETLVAQVKREQGKVDAVIINAGSNAGSHDPKLALPMFAVNYHGALNVAQSFVPLVRKGGRIVVVGASSTQTATLGEDIKKRFFSDDLTIPQLNELISEYEKALPDTPKGWPTEEDGTFHPPYTVSKIGVTTFVRILARDHPDITFLAACPGVTATDMLKQSGGVFSGAKSVTDGTRVVYTAAVGNVNGANGVFWANDSVFSTDVGKPQPNWYGKGIAFGPDP